MVESPDNWVKFGARYAVPIRGPKSEIGRRVADTPPFMGKSRPGEYLSHAHLNNDSDRQNGDSLERSIQREYNPVELT